MSNTSVYIMYLGDEVVALCISSMVTVSRLPYRRKEVCLSGMFQALHAERPLGEAH